MPVKDDSTRNNRVLIPHECYIPIPRHRFLQAIADDVSSEPQKKSWHEFCRLMEAVYHFRFHTIATELKEDFLLFDTRQGTEELMSLSPNEVHQREMRFLSNFVDVMRRGNFRPLTAADVALSEAEDYLFTLPVSVDWDRLDDDLLTRFWKQHPPEPGHDLPDFARRIMVFQRGVGVEQSYALHLLAKVDVVMSGLFEWLLWAPRRVLRKSGSSRSAKRAALRKLQQPVSEEKSHRFENRYIERVPLRSTCRSWKWLFQRSLIQEPTFQELIILYRPAGHAPRKKTDPVPQRDQSIHIKAFNDIPMADLEVVFPEKKISMKPLDLVKLSATGGIGFFMVLTKVVVQAALNPVLALAALGTMAGYASKVLMGFKVSRDRYQHVVTTSLYDKNRDNNLGVIFFLMDSLEEQELKETLLAYYILWRDGTLKQSELDSRCEEFLHARCGVEVDFEVADALEKLAHEGLVTCSGTHYSAIPLDQALAKLDLQWDNYFQFNGVSIAGKVG
jgi:hypothetical protein